MRYENWSSHQPSIPKSRFWIRFYSICKQTQTVLSIFSATFLVFEKHTQKTKKSKPAAFQQYQSELRTPNSLRERFDESSCLVFHFRQRNNQPKLLTFVLFPLCFLVFDCASLLGENRNRDLNFYRTVLEGYWELEARTGTVGKLRFSTFTSFAQFSSPNTNLS